MDLDETLIHYPDTKMSVFQKEFQAHLLQWPGLSIFLKEMSQFYELIIFTAASKEYADRILRFIDPKGYIKHRLYQGHMF